MKKGIFCLLVLFFVCGALFACDEPNPEPEAPHEHTFAEEWSHDLYEHWHAADCGHSDTASEREGHVFWGTVKVRETCTEPGVHILTCSVCEFSTEIDVPPAHRTEQHEGQAATCLTAGYKAYEACVDCNYTTYEEIPAPGHQFGDGVCTVCGDQEPPPHACVGVR